MSVSELLDSRLQNTESPPFTFCECFGSKIILFCFAEFQQPQQQQNMLSNIRNRIVQTKHGAHWNEMFEWMRLTFVLLFQTFKVFHNRIWIAVSDVSSPLTKAMYSLNPRHPAKVTNMLTIVILWLKVTLDDEQLILEKQKVLKTGTRYREGWNRIIFKEEFLLQSTVLRSPRTIWRRQCVPKYIAKWCDAILAEDPCCQFYKLKWSVTFLTAKKSIFING